ncbi:MAG: hypothetical protein IJT04_06750, partial [Bacteroidales bacterium]|nr:hypothetical protein [Bacteroidales bacterium]
QLGGLAPQGILACKYARGSGEISTLARLVRLRSKVWRWMKKRPCFARTFSLQVCPRQRRDIQSRPHCRGPKGNRLSHS